MKDFSKGIKIVFIGAIFFMVMHQQADASELFIKDGSNLIASSGFSMTSLFRGILGIFTIFFISYIFSANRRAVNWKTVGVGLALQLILALGVLYVPFVSWIFEYGGKAFVKIIDFTGEGSKFLLGDLINLDKTGYVFVFQVLPTIVFFSAITSLLFYLGIIQKVVYGMAWVMTKLMKLSGAESLSVAGNIFLGQTESPLMIKAYLEKMNKSEIFLVMVGGMATIAGGVMAAYIGFLGGSDPAMRSVFAKHLLTASVMAAPGAVVIAKILMPQTESISQDIEITKENVGSNILDAIANGTIEGLKLALNIAGMLLVFIAFIALINYVLSDVVGLHTGLNAWITKITHGEYTGFNLQFLLGYLLSPVMWLLGVNCADITEVGRFLGE